MVGLVVLVCGASVSAARGMMDGLRQGGGSTDETGARGVAGAHADGTRCIRAAGDTANCMLRSAVYNDVCAVAQDDLQLIGLDTRSLAMLCCTCHTLFTLDARFNAVDLVRTHLK